MWVSVYVVFKELVYVWVLNFFFFFLPYKYQGHQLHKLFCQQGNHCELSPTSADSSFLSIVLISYH